MKRGPRSARPEKALEARYHTPHVSRPRDSGTQQTIQVQAQIYPEDVALPRDVTQVGGGEGGALAAAVEHLNGQSGETGSYL